LEFDAQVHPGDTIRTGPAYPLGAAFSPEGGTLAVSDADGEIALWSRGADSWTRTGLLRAGDGPARLLSFSADGSLLAAAGAGSTVRLWDVHRGEEALSIHGNSGGIRQLQFHPMRRDLLLTVTLQGDLKVWDVARYEPPERRFPEAGARGRPPRLGLGVTEDGRYLVTGDGRNAGSPPGI
jgi:WD40 repeat protein